MATQQEERKRTLAIRSTAFSECLYGIVALIAPAMVENILVDVSWIDCPNWSTL